MGCEMSPRTLHVAVRKLDEEVEKMSAQCQRARAHLSRADEVGGDEEEREVRSGWTAF